MGNYYIPDITEFNIGFNYEFKPLCLNNCNIEEQVITNKWIKAEFRINNTLDLEEANTKEEVLSKIKEYNSEENKDPKTLKEVEYYLSKDAIRVKYLDKEDIESLGFLFDKKGDSFSNINLKYKNKRFIITQKDYSDLRDKIKDEKLLFKLRNSIIIERNLSHTFYEFPEIIFTGILKNKTELKNILNKL